MCSVIRKGGVYLVLGVAWLVLSAAPVFPQQTGQGRWMEEAEKTFGLSRGMGSQLMTREEWRNHQRTMQGMSPGERKTYRNEWHNMLQHRASRRGLAVPDSPHMGREAPGMMGPGPDNSMMGPGSGRGGGSSGMGRGGMGGDRGRR